MINKTMNYFLGGIMLITFLFPGCSNDRVTLESLLNEMVDRDEIARFDEPQFVTLQFSSYDRGLTDPEEPGWFANSDRTWFIREEMNQGRKEYVMMDTDGPGAIVRFWMTFAGKNSGRGILRFYFDGDSLPEIEGEAFDIISGNHLVGEPLASSVSDLSPYQMRGHNLYLPLPYERHCKITYESEMITRPGNKGNTGESVYYLINYRSYEPEVPVTTFSMEELSRASATLNTVQQKLQTRDRGLEKGADAIEFNASLGPEQTWEKELSGSKAIRSLKMKLSAHNLPQALRSTVIEIEFDGEKTVWCPIGDFFGTGYQIRYSDTWYSHVEQDGTMETFWVMPFKKACRITIRNLGEQEVSFNGNLTVKNWEWDRRSMHFGTSWQQYTNIFTRTDITDDGEGGEPFDLNFVELTGKGVYVGDVLTLFNTAYIWWGEGDEKIYIDRERIPSHLGTGTEDYYGYAWGGRSERYSNHPFIAQPDETGNSKPGYVVNLRFRTLDVIPFYEHLKLDMEMWHWNYTFMNYAPATFYYMKPGGRSNISPDIEGAKARVALESTDIISNVVKSGLIEAEHMSFSNSSGNQLGSMTINRYGNVPLGNHIHVLWRDGEPGDQITFKFISKEEGLFDVTGFFSTGPDFGRFGCSLNGRTINHNLVLSSPERSVKKINLGKQTIRKGENTLIFEVLQGAEQGHHFGFDYLLLE